MIWVIYTKTEGTVYIWRKVRLEKIDGRNSQCDMHRVPTLLLHWYQCYATYLFFMLHAVLSPINNRLRVTEGEIWKYRKRQGTRLISGMNEIPSLPFCFLSLFLACMRSNVGIVVGLHNLFPSMGTHWMWLSNSYYLHGIPTYGSRTSMIASSSCCWLNVYGSFIQVSLTMLLWWEYAGGDSLTSCKEVPRTNLWLGTFKFFGGKVRPEVNV